MSHVEFHLHQDSLQVRACPLAAGVSALRFHAGFSQADVDAGWKQVCAGEFSESEIDTKKIEIVASSKEYWEDLADKHQERRVVVDGRHLVSHDLGTGAGFGGRSFQVDWIDPGRKSLICNLSAQGSVPAWIRDRIPDNALRVTEIN